MRNLQPSSSFLALALGAALTLGCAASGEARRFPAEASDQRDAELRDARRALLVAAEAQFRRGPPRALLVVLAKRWAQVGGDRARALALARRARDIELQAAFGDCPLMVETHGANTPRPVAAGCARAGAIETALRLAAQASPTQARSVLGAVVLSAHHRDLTDRAAAAIAAATVGAPPSTADASDGVNLEVSAARLLASAKHHRQAKRVMDGALSQLSGTPAGVGRGRRLSVLAQALGDAAFATVGWRESYAARLDALARKQLDASQAAALSGMWSRLGDGARARWWLRAGLAALAQHSQSHERLALGCTLAARALALDRPLLFGRALGVSEAEARAAPEAQRSQAWRCIGAALLAGGDVAAADALARRHQLVEVRQGLIVTLARKRQFDEAMRMTRREVRHVSGTTLGALYRLAPSVQHRLAVLALVNRIDDRVARVRAYTVMGRDARVLHRRSEARVHLDRAMQIALGKGVQRSWLGPRVPDTKRQLLVERALTDPPAGVPELLSRRGGPMYLPPSERFAALLIIATELRWHAGVDVRALTASLRDLH